MAYLAVADVAASWVDAIHQVAGHDNLLRPGRLHGIAIADCGYVTIVHMFGLDVECVDNVTHHTHLGEKGRRYALPHSTIMIHQPLGGVSGPAADVAIHAKFLLESRAMLSKLLMQHTGQMDLDVIGKLQVTETSYNETRAFQVNTWLFLSLEKAIDRDNFLNPTAAKEFGLIDHILEKRSMVETAKEAASSVAAAK